jgi:hypothetical protein
MAIIDLVIKAFGSNNISRINNIRLIVKDWLSWLVQERRDQRLIRGLIFL